MEVDNKVVKDEHCNVDLCHHDTTINTISSGGEVIIQNFILFSLSFFCLLKKIKSKKKTCVAGCLYLN